MSLDFLHSRSDALERQTEDRPFTARGLSRFPSRPRAPKHMRGIPTFSRELAQPRSEFVWEVWRLGGSGFARERSDRLMAYAVPLLLVALMRQTPVASPRGGDPYQGRGHAAHTNRRPPQVPLPLRAG
jgi:hypothetical protein